MVDDATNAPITSLNDVLVAQVQYTTEGLYLDKRIKLVAKGGKRRIQFFQQKCDSQTFSK